MFNEVLHGYDIISYLQVKLTPEPMKVDLPGNSRMVRVMIHVTR